MLEFKIVFFSKSEILCGLYLDHGEYEKAEGKWVPYTRFRIGLIFLCLDFMRTH